MRLTLALAAALLLTAAHAAGIASFLGREGPAFEAGMTPASLGWGEDTQPHPDKFVVNPKDLAEMVWVPAGEFQMGTSPEEIEWAFGEAVTQIGDLAKREWFDDEGPAHPVRLTQGFWMYRCEVTNGQLRKFKRSHNAGVREGQPLNGDKQPAVRVSWRDAKGYCDFAEVALPSEAQWEYACRAGTQTRYYWGDDPAETPQYANVPDQRAARIWPQWKVMDVDDGFAVTAPVGSFKPNAFGLHDMIGNVNEWCADWYAPDTYANAPTDAPAEDPTGPASGETRVMRGGSFSVQWYDCRCGNRNNRMWDSQYEYLGFRAIKLP